MNSETVNYINAVNEMKLMGKNENNMYFMWYCFKENVIKHTYSVSALGW